MLPRGPTKDKPQNASCPEDPAEVGATHQCMHLGTSVFSSLIVCGHLNVCTRIKSGFGSNKKSETSRTTRDEGNHRGFSGQPHSTQDAGKDAVSEEHRTPNPYAKRKGSDTKPTYYMIPFILNVHKGKFIEIESRLMAA